MNNRMGDNGEGGLPHTNYGELHITQHHVYIELILHAIVLMVHRLMIWTESSSPGQTFIKIYFPMIVYDYSEWDQAIQVILLLKFRCICSAYDYRVESYLGRFDWNLLFVDTIKWNVEYIMLVSICYIDLARYNERSMRCGGAIHSCSKTRINWILWL